MARAKRFVVEDSEADGLVKVAVSGIDDVFLQSPLRSWHAFKRERLLSRLGLGDVIA